MDRQRTRFTLMFSTMLLVLIGTGCRNQQKQTPAGIAPMPGQSSGGWFSRSNSNFPTPPSEPMVVHEARSKEPISTATQVAFSDVWIESAFAEGQPTIVRDQLIDKARKNYEAALKQDPKDKAALIGMARLYAKSGDVNRTTEVYQQLVQYHPNDAETHFKVASLYSQLGQWQLALQACDRAAAIDPQNRNYLRTKSYCLAQLEQWEQAFTLLIDGNLMPEHEVRYFLGRVLLDMNRIPEGKQQFELALQSSPQFTEAQLILAKINQGPTTAPASIAPPTHPNPLYQAGYGQ